MVDRAPDPLLLVLLGPTGSGKTSLSLTLAQQWHGEIVSCDSVAVYRELEIGSAKPSPDERNRVPHHLLDVVSPEESFTAGDYSRAAREAIAAISARGRLPIVTGGTGLYLRALLEGLFSGPKPQRQGELRHRLRERARIRGPLYLHRLLARLDPVSASRIHAHDLPKVIRAIEVSLTQGQPMSDAWKAGREPLTGFRILRLGLDPDRRELYERINARARKMFDAGLIEETRSLLARYGPPRQPHAPASLDALGYRQASQLLRGECGLEQAISAASQGHRNYAKRQFTWFRREPGVVWLHGFGDDPAIRAAAASLVAEGLECIPTRNPL